jgi:hypothetical protein
MSAEALGEIRMAQNAALPPNGKIHTQEKGNTQ